MEGFNRWQVCMLISIAQRYNEGRECGDRVSPYYCYWCCGNFAAIIKIKENRNSSSLIQLLDKPKDHRYQQLYVMPSSFSLFYRGSITVTLLQRPSSKPHLRHMSQPRTR